jgi:pyrimidine operon attenuation protein / uracil phosphoribosyltransferase
MTHSASDRETAVSETVRDAEWVASQISVLAENLAREFAPSLKEIVLAGIRTRGAVVADRLRDKIRERTGVNVPIVYLDIAFYRDDYATAGPKIDSDATDISVSLDGRQVVLVDDVLHTGRTIRAALDLLMDFGRPGVIRLAVLIDRGGRQLPIAADYTAARLKVPEKARVRLRMAEVDGEDAVVVE